VDLREDGGIGGVLRYRGLVKVRGRIDGEPFESVHGLGEGTHMLRVMASMRKAIGKGPGDEVHVRIEARIG
jgi:hypothetical protein